MKLSTHVIDAMLSSGCSAEQIAAAVKAAMRQDDESVAERKEKDRVRKRLEREQKKASKNNSRVQDVQWTPQDTSDNPLSDKETSPTPPKEINSTPEKKTPPTEGQKKRGARLPDDWSLPMDWGRWALSEGYAEATIRLEADKFRDFWCSKSGSGATKVDWLGTWRNWIRNVPKPRQTAQAPPLTPFQQRTQDLMDACDRVIGANGNDKSPSYDFDLEPADWRAN